MISEKQMPERYCEVINKQIEIYEQGVSVTVRNKIPKTTDIPIENPRHWLRIPDVICVFVDMKGSTQFSAQERDRETAAAYQLFTGTAVRLFDAFEAPYIDVRGDGVIALFNQDQPYTAIAAAVTFKTFAFEEFVERVAKKKDIQVGAHIGIDQNTVLVRKIGMKVFEDRSDRQNEVWAGTPVNMGSKLASLGDFNELIASERFFARITHELVRKSCGCPHGTKEDLWDEIDVSSNPQFDFSKAYRLRSNWCKTHGREYCEAILELDRS